ncbi:hypothetical protein [Marinobacter sp. 1_MG-2023]|uniref:hypothetical protein n=1 Tax=Marinobacter sp. 1_MG-2023 TaxID=3062627 RepID=UPI0026E331BA|nr:hypothetical protein [Marinobacter sp. 1_MG-2023]MDO6824542.1 hypothetical protein [Marinobacter sp. 1_MG-2023]
MEAAFWIYNRAILNVLSGLLTLIFVTAPALCAASDKSEYPGIESIKNIKSIKSIEGISASMGEDEPRVLNILPWRAPTLPRRPRAELENTAPELVQPLDPLVLEHHREFRQNLGVTNPAVRPGEWQ